MSIFRKKPRRKKHNLINGIFYYISKLLKKITGTSLKIVFAVLLIAGFLVMGLVVGSMAAYIDNSPLITDEMLEIEEYNLSSFIYDNDGNSITKLQGSYNVNRTIVPYDDIPKNLSDAFIAIEDERFYDHNGIDYIRIGSAILGLIVPGMPSHGGSTITQQVVKNLTENFEVSLQRKVQEQWQALQLERKLDKWQILEIYMNIIYMGEGSYGVQSASQIYFDKDVEELTLAECASLAGITNGPALYNPFYENSRERNIERKQSILDKMLELGFITEEEHLEASSQELTFNLDYLNTSLEPISYQSYFVDSVVLEVKKDLMTELNISENEALDMIYNKGLNIYTTQDTNLQNEMEKIFSDPENFPIDSNTHAQAAMVVMDPYNGNVLSLYGGYGEKKGNSFNRATQMSRQAGSSFKPIAAYAPAIDRKIITAGSVYNDIPSYLDPENPDTIYPRNYDSDGYEGLTNVRKAIQSSINTVAAKVWLEIPDISLDYLDRVNLNRDDERYISLALGGLYEGVSPLEMAASYQPFVNKGLYYEPRFYSEVVDSEGNVILKNPIRENIVYEDERTSYIMTDMMKDVVTRGTAYPYGIIENKVGDIIPTAGKTGTTSNYYDKWFVGYSPYYVGATWYGYDNNTVLQEEEYRQAQILWKKVMTVAHENSNPIDFEKPSGIQEVLIDKYSGKLPTDLSYKDPRGSSVYKELFIQGTQPYTLDDIHTKVTVCTSSEDAKGRNLLALPWCPIEDTQEKILLDKPQKYELHENEDGSLDYSGGYPRDYWYEVPESYCDVHSIPQDYTGEIPKDYEGDIPDYYFDNINNTSDNATDENDSSTSDSSSNDVDVNE